MLANEYCSPANFDCDSGFREYFLFNSFAEHRSSSLQLSLDCLVQYIDRKFNNQFSLQYEFLHYLTMWPRQHKQKSQVQNLPCRSSIKQQRYVCIIMSVNEGQIHARNKCFLYQNPHGNWWKNSSNAICNNISSMILPVTSSQSNSRGNASNITCPHIEYHVPKVTVEWNRAPTIAVATQGLFTAVRKPFIVVKH